MKLNRTNRIYEINDDMTKEELAERFALLRASTEESSITTEKEKPVSSPLAS